MKLRRVIIASLCGLLAICIAAPFVSESLKVDACLDSGGSFDYANKTCDYQTSHPYVPLGQTSQLPQSPTFLRSSATPQSNFPKPTYATVGEVVSDPLRFDGRLVRINAWPTIGFEGDNYLFDEPYHSGLIESGHPYLWFYTAEGAGGLFSSAATKLESGGIFTGYFHYRPDHRTNGMFDPGPMQFEVTQIFSK